jgi:hypothetical protein
VGLVISLFVCIFPIVSLFLGCVTDPFSDKELALRIMAGSTSYSPALHVTRPPALTIELSPFRARKPKQTIISISSLKNTGSSGVRRRRAHFLSLYTCIFTSANMH